MNNLTLGSLFDGSGGFPLGGLISGITPVWASEIEPFPIRITTKRLPFMKHYGDISQMDGGKIEPVDIITFGSPALICLLPVAEPDWKVSSPCCSIKPSVLLRK